MRSGAPTIVGKLRKFSDYAHHTTTHQLVCLTFKRLPIIPLLLAGHVYTPTSQSEADIQLVVF